MKDAWVLVADACQARVFRASTPTGALHEIEGFEHPKGRLKITDLVTDGQGRFRDRATAHKSAMSPAENAKETEAERFSRQLVDFLEHGRVSHRFDRMYLMAPPAMLGRLREKLSNPLARLVRAEIGKAMTHLSSDEVRQVLPDRL